MFLQLRMKLHIVNVVSVLGICIPVFHAFHVLRVCHAFHVLLVFMHFMYFMYFMYFMHFTHLMYFMFSCISCISCIPRISCIWHFMFSCFYVICISRRAHAYGLTGLLKISRSTLLDTWMSGTSTRSGRRRSARLMRVWSRANKTGLSILRLGRDSTWQWH